MTEKKLESCLGERGFRPREEGGGALGEGKNSTIFFTLVVGNEAFKFNFTA